MNYLLAVSYPRLYRTYVSILHLSFLVQYLFLSDRVKYSVYIVDDVRPQPGPEQICTGTEGLEAQSN